MSTSTGDRAFTQSCWLEREYSHADPAHSRLNSTILVLVCAVGTGGISDANYWASRQHLGYRPLEIQERPASTAALSVSEKLVFARETLKASMASLAASLNVSRQGLYNWLGGESPTPERGARIDDLYSAAKRLAAAGVAGSQIAKRKISGGKTLLELVAAGDSATQTVEKLVRILEVEAAQQRMLAMRLRGKSPGAADSDMGASMHSDRA